MPGLAIASRRNPSELVPEPLDRLAADLAARMSRLPLDDMTAVIADALRRVAAAASVGICRLIEFNDQGDVAGEHGMSAGDALEAEGPVVQSGSWLIERMIRGELVVISKPCDLPPDAIAAQERAERARVCSLVAVPAAAAGRVVSALVVEDSRMWRHWSRDVLEGLQLISDILAVTLQRSRHETALRTSLAEIERLNVRLKADTLCLKEEIKSHHDFDEIVGESDALTLALTRLGRLAPTSSSV